MMLLQMKKTKTTWLEREKLRLTAGLAVLASIINPVHWFDNEARIRAQIYYTARFNGYSPYNAETLVKQSNLETGFQSLGFYDKSNYNLFGMQRATKRIRSQLSSVYNESEGAQSAVYKSHQQSIIDRILWDMYHRIEPSTVTYLEEVQRFSYNPKKSYQADVENTSSQLSQSVEIIKFIFCLILIIIPLLLLTYIYKTFFK